MQEMELVREIVERKEYIEQARDAAHDFMGNAFVRKHNLCREFDVIRAIAKEQKELDLLRAKLCVMRGE